MSGTSMDAVDVALVEFDQHASLIAYRQYPIDEQLKHKIRPVNASTSLQDVAEIDYRLGELFASSVNRFLLDTNTSAEKIKAIGSHGQTVYHRPASDWQTSIQLGDPNIICARTGITTVADFRRMDMACAGQGAPLAPAFHRYQFRSTDINRTVLNIGGIANISNLPAIAEMDITGFDTGPGNGLLDDWNFMHNKTAMDKDSNWAKSGSINADLLNRLLDDPYFKLEPPKSTGRDYFNLDWLNDQMQEMNIKAVDVQATLLQLSIQTIADSITATFPGCEEIYACGGGAQNKTMLERLQALLPEQKVMTTASLGIDPDAVEAVTFAWLAYCRITEQLIDLGSITGADRKILPGAVYKFGS